MEISRRTIGYADLELRSVMLSEKDADLLHVAREDFFRTSRTINNPTQWPHFFFLALKRGDQRGVMVWGRWNKILMVDIKQEGTNIHNILRDDDYIKPREEPSGTTFLGKPVWSFSEDVDPAELGWELDEETQDYIRETF